MKERCLVASRLNLIVPTRGGAAAAGTGTPHHQALSGNYFLHYNPTSPQISIALLLVFLHLKQSRLPELERLQLDLARRSRKVHAGAEEFDRQHGEGEGRRMTRRWV